VIIVGALLGTIERHDPELSQRFKRESVVKRRDGRTMMLNPGIFTKRFILQERSEKPEFSGQSRQSPGKAFGGGHDHCKPSNLLASMDSELRNRWR
jgi:hypothetical protein